MSMMTGNYIWNQVIVQNIAHILEIMRYSMPLSVKVNRIYWF